MGIDEFLRGCLELIQRIEIEDLPLFFDGLMEKVKGNREYENFIQTLCNVSMRERKEALN